MDSSFPWDDLLDYILDGKVVPILGHELLEAEYQGRRVSLQRLLAERLAEREKLDVQWTPHSELNDAVVAYLANPQAKMVGLYDRISGFLRSLDPPFPVPDALLRLAEIRSFDLFVSLTFDSLMARALDQVRFGGKAVTREIEFSLNQPTAAQSEAIKMRLGEEPIVFNLFGRAVTKSDFALHDEDALEFIHRLVSGDVPPPEWLLSELRNRHLLMLGVHLPDWLERFVLRAATRDRLRLAQRAYFIAGENASSAATLTQFLHRFGRETSIAVFDGRAEEFVGELHRRWKAREPQLAAAPTPTGAPQSEGARGGIFISYGRENLAAVERLHRAIESLGGDAWFDRTELTAGDHWEQKILPQIQRDVRLFVPVISDGTATRREGYVFREWREAVERSKKIVGRKFILPVVVDADYKGNLERYQCLVDEFPAFQELHFGQAPGGEPDEALQKTLIDEIRAMRREEAR
jgi:TIR domain